MRGIGLGALAALAAITVIAAVLRRRIAVVAVDGPSMQPTLAAGERVLVRRAGISDMHRGQIVVFEKPGRNGSWVTKPPRWLTDRREWMIKRVAAVPGRAAARRGDSPACPSIAA
jgi:signal peptidase I